MQRRVPFITPATIMAAIVVIAIMFAIIRKALGERTKPSPLAEHQTEAKPSEAPSRLHRGHLTAKPVS